MLNFFIKAYFNTETPKEELEVLDSALRTEMMSDCTVYTFATFRMEKKTEITAYFYNDKAKDSEEDKQKLENKYFDELISKPKLSKSIRYVELNSL